MSYSYSTYDLDNQLKNAKFSDSSNTTVSFAYTYTPDNQLATENDTGTYAGSSYTYSTGNSYDNNGNRTGSGISTGADNEIGTQGSMAYLYDNNGNRLLAAQMSGATLTAYNDYVFDPRNRLTRIDAPWVSQSVSYSYDPENQRIEEQDVTTTATTYTEFAYDPGGNLVMELNKGATSVTDTYLPDRSGGVAPLAHEDASGNVTWLLPDRNGSVQDEVNNAGVFSDRLLFNAFGQKTENDSAPSAASIYGFQGEEQPVSSTPSGILALDRNGVSWTDPALQNAFISPDPKGFAAGTNAYERDGNNPVNNTDPSGLEFQTGTSSAPSAPAAWAPLPLLSVNLNPGPVSPSLPSFVTSPFAGSGSYGGLNPTSIAEDYTAATSSSLSSPSIASLAPSQSSFMGSNGNASGNPFSIAPVLGFVAPAGASTTEELLAALAAAPAAAGASTAAASTAAASTATGAATAGGLGAWSGWSLLGTTAGVGAALAGIAYDAYGVSRFWNGNSDIQDISNQIQLQEMKIQGMQARLAALQAQQASPQTQTAAAGNGGSQLPPTNTMTGALPFPGSTGGSGEEYLKSLGGESQVRFDTSIGPRTVDQLVEGINHESKVGYQTLTADARLQIAKDVELVQEGQVKGSTWHFFQSPVTGEVGPSQPLADALRQAGIDIVIH